MTFPFSFWKPADGGGPSLPEAILPAYWSLEETGGVRADATGNANTLTDVNSVTSATGKNGGGALFNAEGQMLLATAGSSRSWFTGDFTVSCWVQLEDKLSESVILAKYGFSDPSFTHQMVLTYDNAFDRFRFYMIRTEPEADPPYELLFADTFGSPSTGEFYHIACGRRGDEIFIRVNGVEDTAVFTSVIPATNEAPFAIGNIYDPVDALFPGVIDEVAVWQRALSSEELGDLYNGGAGLFFGDTGFPA